MPSGSGSSIGVGETTGTCKCPPGKPVPGSYMSGREQRVGASNRSTKSDARWSVITNRKRATHHVVLNEQMKFTEVFAFRLEFCVDKIGLVADVYGENRTILRRNDT